MSTNIEEALLKAGEVLLDSDKPVTSSDLQEFFGGLTEVLNDAIGADVSGEFTKAQMVGMGAFLEGLAKLSDADLAAWLREGRFDPAKVFDHPASLALWQRMGQPQDPDKGWGTSPPGSSSPSPRVSKAVAASLDKLANATPEDIERAKSGLTQLDPDDESMDKSSHGRGKLIQSLEGEVDEETEAALRQGNINMETELRKGIVLNGTALLHRVAKMRDRLVATERTDLTDDKSDDWEAAARQGNA